MYFVRVAGFTQSDQIYVLAHLEKKFLRVLAAVDTRVFATVSRRRLLESCLTCSEVAAVQASAPKIVFVVVCAPHVLFNSLAKIPTYGAVHAFQLTTHDKILVPKCGTQIFL